ncbi:iron ABC transporter permease [Actinoplanes sp. NEAU-A12]|uniref:Iron ABC transporter permease n=1 Tax=Actinoplanes sandaracinus TaxID=3045177 RepID=A0ABT6WX14_9ACTN|nr:iron ABC transporter permease [Actinoplanes sandaracinus]MDI6104166.1 iron ABC transporter permease [Actinoplanes sandaracinus]
MSRPVLTAAAGIAVVVALLPLGYLLIRVTEAGLDRAAAELLTARVGRLAATSLALAAVVTLACTVLGVGSAFLVTRTDLPAARLFAVLAALPLAVPTYIAAFAWVSAVDDFTGFWPSALVLTLCSYPYVFLPVAAALHRADPAQEDVARSLGHHPWRTFRGVTLPQLRPAIAGGALLVALYVLSDFGAVALLRTDTFTRAVFTAFDLGFDLTGALLLSTVLVALTTVLLIGESLTRRRGARYARLGAGARRPHVRIPLGGRRWPAALMLMVAAALALGVPALNLSRRLAAGVSRPGSLTEIATAAGNSLTVSAAGAVLTMLLALPIGLLVARASGPLAAVVERLSYLTHALPGVVIGLSLVFFGVHVAYPLYQTRWLLTLAYAALFLPLAVAAVSAAAAQAPPALDDVARSLGRRPLRVFITITAPLLTPGIAAGAALVFLTCMKELPATLLLRPTGMDTLATELWGHTGVAAYAAAAPYAALLVLLSAVPAWFLAARSGALGPEGNR